MKRRRCAWAKRGMSSARQTNLPGFNALESRLIPATGCPDGSRSVSQNNGSSPRSLCAASACARVFSSSMYTVKTDGRMHATALSVSEDPGVRDVRPLYARSRASTLSPGEGALWRLRLFFRTSSFCNNPLAAPVRPPAGSPRSRSAERALGSRCDSGSAPSGCRAARMQWGRARAGRTIRSMDQARSDAPLIDMSGRDRGYGRGQRLSPSRVIRLLMGCRIASRLGQLTSGSDAVATLTS